MKASQSKNTFNIISGYSKAIGANSNSFQKAIVLQSAQNIKKRIHGIILRYKPGLEDVGVQIESKNIKNLIKGYLPISVLGAPYGAPSFHIFPFFGRKPMIEGKEVVEIKLQTQGTAISSKDVSASLLVEEIVEDDPEQYKKNPFYLLAGTSDTVAINKDEVTAIILANDFSSDVKIHGWVTRYKTGLDDVLIDLYSASLARTGGIIEGDMTLALAGSRFDSPCFDHFPLPGKKPILGLNDQIEVLLSTNSTAVGAREVGIALIVEGQ
ncbi:MAG: hypothetical protein O9264_08770 [Leptospira sp.]|nr:hypothetical protein [Leptospira sp.]